MEIVSGAEAMELSKTLIPVEGWSTYAADLKGLTVSTKTNYVYSVYSVEPLDDFDAKVVAIKAAAGREGLRIDLSTNEQKSLIYVRRLT